MAAVTFKDNYFIMTSFVTSCRWIFITQQANLIVSVTDGISLLNFQELINGGLFSAIPRFLELPRILAHLPYMMNSYSRIITNDFWGV